VGDEVQREKDAGGNKTGSRPKELIIIIVRGGKHMAAPVKSGNQKKEGAVRGTEKVVT